MPAAGHAPAPAASDLTPCCWSCTCSRSEYEEKDSEIFDTLVARLRATEEWGYVDREVDVRLVKL